MQVIYQNKGKINNRSKIINKLAVAKQTKTTKTLIMLLLITTICSMNIGSIYNNSSNIASATSQSVTFSVEAASTLSISVASQVNLDITPSNTGTFGDVDLPITVKTNNEYGYNLTMSAYNTNLLRNTALSNGTVPNIPTIDNNSGSGYTTEQFTSSSSTMNKWGYKVGSGNYGPVAVNATTLKECGVTELTNSTCTPQTATGDVTTLNFASKIDNNTPSGTYSTTLILMAVANVATSNCTTGYICYNNNGADNGLGGGTMGNQTADGTADTTLWASNFSNTGYGFAGWNTKSDGTGTSYGPNQTLSTTELTNLISQNSGNGITLYANWIPAERNGDTIITMQDWAAQNGCSKMAVGAVTALKDARDNNVYAIAKLPMGWNSTNSTYTEAKCWMIENMRINNSATISNTNTNNPLSTLTELAASTTSWCTTQDAACYNQSKLNTINTTTNSNYAGATGNGNDNNLAVYSYGNYYNWYSATAGNGTYEFNTNNTSTSGDICPLNWSLPVGGGVPNASSSAYGDNSANSDFYKLSQYLTQDATLSNSQYSQSYYANLSYTYRAYPNNFVYSGVWDGSQAYYRGTDGYYWSSTANTAAYAYYLNFYSSDVYPGTSNYVKYYGFSARCVAGN